MKKDDYELIIKKTYNELLNRDPEPEGLKHFMNLLTLGKLNESELRNSIKNSLEFKQIQISKLLESKKSKKSKLFIFRNIQGNKKLKNL